MPDDARDSGGWQAFARSSLRELGKGGAILVAVALLFWLLYDNVTLGQIERLRNDITDLRSDVHDCQASVDECRDKFEEYLREQASSGPLGSTR